MRKVEAETLDDRDGGYGRQKRRRKRRGEIDKAAADMCQRGETTG